MTSLQATILDEAGIAEAHVGPGAHSIGTSVGAVGKTFEGIGLVQNVATVARARVGTGADTIQAGLITRGVTFVPRWTHLVARFAGARFRSGAEPVEATI